MGKEKSIQRILTPFKKGRIERLMITSKTPLKSIRIKCLDCGSTPHQVKICEFTDCPLYLMRFGRSVPNGISRLKAIRTYCLWCMNDMRKEIALCPSTRCSLHPYRFGKNPYRSRTRLDKPKTQSEYPIESLNVVADRQF